MLQLIIKAPCWHLKYIWAFGEINLKPATDHLTFVVWKLMFFVWSNLIRKSHPVLYLKPLIIYLRSTRNFLDANRLWKLCKTNTHTNMPQQLTLCVLCQHLGPVSPCGPKLYLCCSVWCNLRTCSSRLLCQLLPSAMSAATPSHVTYAGLCWTENGALRLRRCVL